MTMEQKLKAFAEKITQERFEYMKEFSKDYSTDPEKIWQLHGASSCQAKVIPGKKYTKVDVGSSGKYMIDNATGEIFGIKGYGVIHKGHRYGTLDTIDQYYWGDYTARKRG